MLLAACGTAETKRTDTVAAIASADSGIAPRVPEPALGAGEAMLPVRGGRIWYKLSGSGKGTPMVLLHGGPGAGSYYLKPFEDIGDDRPIIRYDQLGAGKSDRLTDTTLMNIPRFVAELDSLRRALSIDKWFVNGQSWGTVLALEYYKAHPDEFYARYVWRRPVKVDLDSTMARFGGEQYNYMQGAYEFVVTGTLKDYDARADLPKIKVPVLSTAGEFDEVGPKTVEAHAKMIPGAKFVLYKDASHVTTWDARDENVKDVREFLRSVDKR